MNMLASNYVGDKQGPQKNWAIQTIKVGLGCWRNVQALIRIPSATALKFNVLVPMVVTDA